MKNVRTLLAVLFIGLGGSLFAQLSEPGTPKSFLTKSLSEAIPTLVMPALNMDAVANEDLADEAAGLPPRFGYPFEVDYHTGNSGQWEAYPDGGRVWRLRVQAPGAISINFCYSAWSIPEGGQVWIYSADRSHVIGTFTSNNAHPDGGFATGLVYGDDVIIEYYEPASAYGTGIINISRIVHGYRYVYELVDVPGVEESFGDSGNCQVNVNCSPEGNNWQDEKRSVAMILSSGFRLCTGSMINNVREDCTPYFLTAHHCRDGFDAVSNPNMSSWSFYWMYESPGCADGSDFLPPSTNGATMVANDAPSDFALLLLNENPANIAGVNPWFNGWNATTSVPAGGVGIHHPSGDIKKIATHSMTPLPDDWFGSFPAGSHWEVNWDATPNGHSVTEGGSSGSPLYDANSRVIGQLHGGSSINCSDPANDPGIYGAMWYSLNNAGATDNRRKLSPWLDPDGTGTTVLDGSYAGCSSACFPPSGLAASSITTSGATLSWSAVTGALGYDVRYRESGTTPWTTSSTSGTSLSISGLNGCTNYEFQVATQCDSSTSSFSLSAPFVSDGCPCPTYCTSGGGTVDEWIDAVTIGGLTNASGDNGGYVDFSPSGITATYDQGATYPVTLTPGYAGTVYGEWFHIYIDYNQDGDFDDVGELAYDAGGTVSGTSATGSLTIPSTAPDGTTGLRVVMVWNTAPNTCGTVTYGETEDYCITIGESTATCSSTNAPGNPVSSVGATTVSLSWDPVPESLGCQVRGTQVSPPGPTGTQNVIGFEVSGTSVPFSALTAGTTWDWEVRCTCSLDPVDATPFSVSGSFTVPVLREADLSTALNAWPNPADQQLNVRYEAAFSGTAVVRLTDMLGRTVLQTQTAVLAGPNTLSLNTAGLSSGHYILNLVDGQGIGQQHVHIEH
jgi:hypothetical protein